MIYQREGLLSPTECEEILALCTKLDDGKLEAASKVVRKSRVTFLDGNEHPAIARIDTTLRGVNERFYKFDVNARELVQLAEYRVGDEYAWHLDLGPKDTARRKLSASVQLSKATDYDGGDLQFWGCDDIISREQGTLVVFPSYQLHRVTLVTRGMRHSLVAWATGLRSFR